MVQVLLFIIFIIIILVDQIYIVVNSSKEIYKETDTRLEFLHLSIISYIYIFNMGALLSRLWKEHSLKIISVCIICVATLDPRKILYHLISSTRNVILSGVGIVAAVAMVLTVREAYIILQENKRQEELLAKQKIDDRKNANVFKNAREKLDRMIRRGGKKDYYLVHCF